jgi:hypothetical protein
MIVYTHIPSIYMGELTTLAVNAPNKASLRTTIPMFIVKQWGLKAGGKLDWSLEARKNEVIIVVRKVESSKKK